MAPHAAPTARSGVHPIASTFGDLLSWIGQSVAAVAAGIGGAFAEGLSRQAQRAKAAGDRMMARLFAPGGYVAGSGAGAWSGDRYEQVLRFTGWTYIAVKAIAEELAGLHPQVAWVRSLEEATRAKARGRKMLGRHARRKALAPIQSHEDLDPVDSDHPLLRLLQNPNGPDTGWTFRYRSTIYLELTGNAYWWVAARNGLGLPAELWVLPSPWMRPVGGQQRLVDAYEVRPWGGFAGAKSLVIPAEDVIHFGYPGPLSVVDGWSGLQACAPWLDTAASMDVAQLAAFKLGVRPDLILALDPAFGDPQDTVIDRIQARFEARYGGEARSARPIIVPGGVKAQPTNRAPAEMDFQQSGDMSRDRILAVHRVSKLVAGITEEVSRATGEAALAGFRQRTIRPKLQMHSGVLTERLARQYDRRLVAYFDDPTPEDPDVRRADTQMLLSSGALTLNEARAEYGYEAYAHGGDDPILPAGVAPLPLNTGEDLGGLEALLQGMQRPKPAEEGQTAEEEAQVPAQVPKPPALPKGLARRKSGTFNEQDHPRADDGRFGSGGGSDKPPAGASASPGNSWEDRQAHRDTQREALSGADVMSQDLSGLQAAAKDLSATHNGFGPTDTAPVEQLRFQIQAVGNEYRGIYAALGDQLKEAGANDAELSRLGKVVENTLAATDRKAEAYLAQVQKFEDAKAALAELQASEPEEPEASSPEYPEEPEAPDDEDSEEYGQWEDAHATWEAEVEKIDADREKADERAAAQWEKEHDRWEAACEKADAAIDRAYEKTGEAFEAYEESDDEGDTKRQDALEAVKEKIEARLDQADEDDPEPEEEQVDEDEDEEKPTKVAEPRRRLAAGRNGQGAH